MASQVLIAAPISLAFEQFLLRHGYELITNLSHSFEVEGIVTSNKLKLSAEVLTSYSKLRWIARLGSGMEIIDTSYCDQRGIHYFSSPNGIANSVAEHTTGMLLSLMHHIHSSYQEIQNDQWIREPNRGQEIESLTLGIIGYGHTGSAFASKMSSFCKRIIAYDKYKSGFSTDGVTEVPIEDILHHADILSFHVPLTDETTYYYNDGFINQMSKPHYLINVSRGSVCDTKAILKGLQSGKILGACLDVLDEEKNINHILSQPNHILKQLLAQNVLLTPHIAGYSHQAIEKMSHELMTKLESIL